MKQWVSISVRGFVAKDKWECNGRHKTSFSGLHTRVQPLACACMHTYIWTKIDFVLIWKEIAVCISCISEVWSQIMEFKLQTYKPFDRNITSCVLQFEWLLSLLCKSWIPVGGIVWGRTRWCTLVRRCHWEMSFSFQSPCHFHLALCLSLACGSRCSVGVIMTAFVQSPKEGTNEFTSNYLFCFIHCISLTSNIFIYRFHLDIITVFWSNRKWKDYFQSPWQRSVSIVKYL